MNRPKNTTLPPWRGDRETPTLSFSGARPPPGPSPPPQPRAPMQPQPVPAVVAGDGRDRRDERDQADVEPVRRTGVERRGDQRRLPGQGNAHAFQRDEQEHRQVPVGLQKMIDQRHAHDAKLESGTFPPAYSAPRRHSRRARVGLTPAARGRSGWYTGGALG